MSGFLFHFFQKNVLSALVVSFVAISLGASFGVMSGRGALSGMMGAGIIAFVTSLLGGTRVQCSGPTAPMSAVSVAVLVSASSLTTQELSGMSITQIFNFTVVLSGVILVLLAIFRCGNFIRLIPNTVISGFMSGIAILIWIAQIKQLFVVDGQWMLTQTQWLNVGIVLLTLAVIGLPSIKQKHIHQFVTIVRRFCPLTLIAILVGSLVVHVFKLPVATISIDASLFSNSMSDWFKAQIPHTMSWDLLWFSLPLAFELALLCYLDTLMTALVMDKLSHEKTRRNQELIAQGAGNALSALCGGLPGAQATIRSVLILKEGATSRLAGMLVGVFVILELLIFLDWIRLIPQAVFIGILFKVGYDVFDRTIVLELRKKWRKEATPLALIDLPLMILTILVTIFYNLSAAAIGATCLFYIVQKISHNALPDLDGLISKEE